VAVQVLQLGSSCDHTISPCSKITKFNNFGMESENSDHGIVVMIWFISLLPYLLWILLIVCVALQVIIFSELCFKQSDFCPQLGKWILLAKKA
jgi:hypothetical protein